MVAGGPVHTYTTMDAARGARLFDFEDTLPVEPYGLERNGVAGSPLSWDTMGQGCSSTGQGCRRGCLYTGSAPLVVGILWVLVSVRQSGQVEESRQGEELGHFEHMSGNAPSVAT